jgi:hypothetical protein
MTQLEQMLHRLARAVSGARELGFARRSAQPVANGSWALPIPTLPKLKLCIAKFGNSSNGFGQQLL